MTKDNTFKEASEAFRAHIPDLTSPRFTTAAKQDVYEYAQFFRDHHAPPWLYNLTLAWEKLYAEPYKGVTVDGTVQEGLFKNQDEGVDIEGIVGSAEQLLASLDDDQRRKLQYPVNAKEWRGWSNPEILLRPNGLRLEEVSGTVAQGILSIIQSSLSPEGYEKAIAAMRINHFLGEVVKLPHIMNKYSYNFLLFGNPSTSSSSPWGWLLYGHHLALAVFFKGPQIIISPTFTGAEPNIIDAGEWAGTSILQQEGDLGLKLMQSLSTEQQKCAQVFKQLLEPEMILGDILIDRWNRDDQRHVCGAFRDNRILPYEGLPCSEFSLEQQDLLFQIIEEFILYLPAKSRALRLQQIKQHLDETHFSWIGGYGDDDAFYYRVHSPVIIVEFDHHSGVFLNNKTPMKFHTHTLVRTPNAGDYGQAIRDTQHMLE